MHIKTNTLLTLLFSISTLPTSLTAIPTPAPAPASRITKADLSYLASMFAKDELTLGFRLRSDGPFPLADPLTSKRICGRAYANQNQPEAQCCCMFLHAKDVDEGLGILSARVGHGRVQIGNEIRNGVEREGRGRLGSLGRGIQRFWGDGPGAEDAMVTCGLGVGTGICEV